MSLATPPTVPITASVNVSITEAYDILSGPSTFKYSNAAISLQSFRASSANSNLPVPPYSNPPGANNIGIYQKEDGTLQVTNLKQPVTIIFSFVNSEGRQDPNIRPVGIYFKSAGTTPSTAVNNIPCNTIAFTGPRGPQDNTISSIKVTDECITTGGFKWGYYLVIQIINKTTYTSKTGVTTTVDAGAVCVIDPEVENDS